MSYLGNETQISTENAFMLNNIPYIPSLEMILYNVLNNVVYKTKLHGVSICGVT